MKRIGVLFVCMGNICRSPTAEGVFRNVLQQRGIEDLIEVDSAGTLAYHEGEPPDPRSQAMAQQHRIDISAQRARRVCPEDFVRYDYILAMDSDNMADLERACPPEFSTRLKLLCDFAPHMGVQDVPDPYYGGGQGFEKVFQIIDASCAGLLKSILENHFPDHVHLA